MKSKNTILLSLTIIFSMFVGMAHAQSLSGRYTPRMMQGVRPLAMGNAFIAVKGTDENAIFYNPAAINDYEKEIHMQFLLPSVEMSYKSLGFFIDDIPGLADDIDDAATDGDKINAFDAFTQANTGRYEEVNTRGNVAILMHKYITAALFYESRAVMALTNPTSSTVDIEALSQGGLMVGSAYSFFQDHLQAGIAVKVIGRHLIDATITQRDVITTDEFSDILDLKSFGIGVGVDLGVKGQLPIEDKYAWWDYLDPVFAITLQDVGHTRFFSGDPVGKQKQSLTAGFAIHPDFWKLKSTLAVDFRNLEYATDIITKLHVGYELTWPEISKILRSASVRLGVNQGYFSGGFGVDFRYFKLNAAAYGREIGQSTRQKQSFMLALQLAAGF
jgi:hypothetical protein